MKMQSVYIFVKLAESNCDFGVHKTLGIPRSSMWSYISDLEKTLGKRLINRKKQHLSFTAAGQDFIPFARLIYQTYEESLVNAKSVNDASFDGDILISVTSAIGFQWSMKSIKKLYTEYPLLKLHISASDTITKDEENAYDVHIRPFGGSDQYDKVWYINYNHGLYASQSYIDHMGMPQTPEDLFSHRMIGYGEHKFSYFDDINWHLKGHGYGLPKLKPALTINSTRANFEAATYGLGICSYSHQSNEGDHEHLIRILPDIVGPTIKTYFLIKKDLPGRKLRSIQIFRTYFEKYVREQGIEIVFLENNE